MSNKTMAARPNMILIVMDDMGYGDTIECIDHYIGSIMATLDKFGLGDNTLIAVTSDNGPWYEGSPGGARGRKFDVYEGGIRVPFVARWPRGFSGGTVCREPAHLMDLMPTFLPAAGASAPAGLDGRDITALLRGQGVSPHDVLFVYHGNDLKAAIRGRWKLHLKCQRGEYMRESEFPKLHDLDADPEESYCLATRHPDIVADLTARIRAFDAELRPFYVEEPVPKE